MDAQELATRPLPPLIRSLLDPAAYPHPVEEATLIQTHTSFILLAGERAYKIKKAVNLGFLDFSALDRREHFCRREVELNRRLAPDLYLGVMPIVVNGDRVRIGGAGTPVEWAVVMARVPEERFLEALLAQDRVRPGDVVAIARRLATFHATAATGPEIDAFGQPAVVRRNAIENLEQIQPFIGRTISAAQLETIRRFTEQFLAEHADTLAARVAARRIRDCHGDLHVGNVILGSSVDIFDCIEFDDRYRYGDVAGEVAFLAMDLERFGRADLAWQLVHSYCDVARDPIPDVLLAYYKAYRALVRAKVESLKLDQSDFLDRERDAAGAAAQIYADLALTHAGGIARPALLLTSGLMGTGKSTLAREAAMRFGMVCLSSDPTRKQFVGVPAEQHHDEPYRQGIDGGNFSLWTDNTLLGEAQEWLNRGCSAVIDASFGRTIDREQARQIAAASDARFLVAECVCPDAVAHARLDARRAHPATRTDLVSDARWELFARQKADVEACTELEPSQHLVVDTTAPISACIDHIRASLSVRHAGA